MENIYSSCTATVTELKKSPTKVINDSNGQTVAILNHNSVIGYLIPPKAYETLILKNMDSK